MSLIHLYTWVKQQEGERDVFHLFEYRRLDQYDARCGEPRATSLIREPDGTYRCAKCYRKMITDPR